MKVLAAGTGPGSTPVASRAAQMVVDEAYGSDLLAKNKTRVIDHRLVERASLILCMSKSHVSDLEKRYPAHVGKITTLGAFVGSDLEIDDPYDAPNEASADALQRYRSCFNQLRQLIETHIDTIYSAVVRGRS